MQAYYDPCAGSMAFVKKYEIDMANRLLSNGNRMPGLNQQEFNAHVVVALGSMAQTIQDMGQKLNIAV